MGKYNFNSGWKFFRGKQGDSVFAPDFDDEAWETVTLGHTVRLEPVHASGMVNYQGDAWYRKHFFLDRNFQNQKLYLKFEGAMQEAAVYLNGEKIKESFCGFLPFIADITELVRFDEENVIAVWVNNEDNKEIPPGKPQAELDFCYFGGLYRDAWLIKKPLIHITDELFEDIPAGGGIFVRYENVSRESAELRIKVHIRKEDHSEEAVLGTVRCRLFDGDLCVQEQEQTLQVEKEISAALCMRLENPRLWSVSQPHLYRLCVETAFGEYRDWESVNIGIKDIRFTEKDCILNGEKILLTGCNRHQEYPWIGNALPDALQWRDACMIKDAGWNIVRTGHYPQDKAFMDACDRIGLLVITPTPGWQYYPVEEHTLFDRRVEENTRRMVRYLRNHASVAFWEPVINEEGKTPDAFRRMTYQAVHEEYPGDQCYCAIDEEYDTQGLYDIIYKKTQEKNPHKPGFTREYGDSYREQFDGYEPKIYRVNREANAFGGFYPGGRRAMIENMLVRTSAQNMEGKRTDLARSVKGKYQSHEKGFDTGFCLWAGFDHNRGYCSNPACVGAIDFYRIPKYQFYAFQAKNKNGRPMVYLMEYENRVWVVSNCDCVRLYQDDRFIGEQETKDRALPSAPVCFSLTGEWSVLRAEGVQNGQPAAEMIKRRQKKPERIVIKAPDYGYPLKADGNDKLMVYAYIIDQNGTVCEDITYTMKYEVEGPARIVGGENPRIRASKQQVCMGVGAFLIEAEKTAGQITLQAHADGLQSGRLLITSVPSERKEIPYIVRGNTDHENVVYEEEQTDRQEKGTRDLARRKPASASSGNPYCANDGNYATEWAADPSDEAPQWMVDLQCEQNTGGIRILWAEDSTTYAYDIEVGGADKLFRTVLSKSSTGQDIGVIPFAHENVRYVRIKIRSVSKGTAAISAVELYA